MKSRRDKIRDKVLSNVKLIYSEVMESECWIWQGSNSGKGRGGGYPRMSLDGHTVAVHKVMFVNENGLVPGKKQLDHLCRNTMCVNPKHLEMVTHLRNQKRRAAAQKRLKES